MSTEQSLYPPTKSCGCVKFVGGRKKRRTRRKRRKHHKKRKTHHRHKSHKRHRTRHRHKRRRTRHRRRKVGGVPTGYQGIGGGYVKRGGKKIPFSVSDIPPGKAFEKFIKRDKKKAKEFAKKMKGGQMDAAL